MCWGKEDVECFGKKERAQDNLYLGCCDGEWDRKSASMPVRQVYILWLSAGGSMEDGQKTMAQCRRQSWADKGRTMAWQGNSVGSQRSEENKEDERHHSAFVVQASGQVLRKSLRSGWFATLS
jgi:hypothetical protein